MGRIRAWGRVHILLHTSRRAGLIALWLGTSLFAADVDSFIKPWIAAIQSKDPAKIKPLFHPKVLACMNEQTREYFEYSFAREVRYDLKAGYKVTRIAPVESAPSFPPDIFTYPVQPTHEIQVEIGNTTLIRYLAAVNGKWYEVYPCPTEKGIALIHQQIEQRK